MNRRIGKEKVYYSNDKPLAIGHPLLNEWKGLTKYKWAEVQKGHVLESTIIPLDLIPLNKGYPQ